MRAGRRLLELRRRTGVEWMDLAFLSGRSPLCSGAGAALGSCRWWWCGFDLLFAPALLLFPPAIIILSPLAAADLGEGRGGEGDFSEGIGVCVQSSPLWWFYSRLKDDRRGLSGPQKSMLARFVYGRGENRQFHSMLVDRRFWMAVCLCI